MKIAMYHYFGITGLAFALATTLAEGGVMKDVRISGNYLVVWNIVYADFNRIEDLSAEQKNLNEYEIAFGEDEQNYVITFTGRLLSEMEAKRLNRIILGREMRYWIDKKTMRIAKRLFNK